MKKINTYQIFLETKSSDDIAQQLKKQLINIGGVDSKYEVKLIDNRAGKENKIIKMSFDENGDTKVDDIVSAEEELTEGLKKDLMIGVVCTILASGMVSCKKETSPEPEKIEQSVVKTPTDTTKQIENPYGYWNFNSPCNHGIDGINWKTDTIEYITLCDENWKTHDAYEKRDGVSCLISKYKIDKYDTQTKDLIKIHAHDIHVNDRIIEITAILNAKPTPTFSIKWFTGSKYDGADNGVKVDSIKKITKKG